MNRQADILSTWAREKAQSVMCLLCKHEALSAISRIHKTNKTGTGEMVYWLRALVLSEDPGLSSSTHTSAYDNNRATQVPGDLTPPPGPNGTNHASSAPTSMQVKTTYTQQLLMYKNLKTSTLFQEDKNYSYGQAWYWGTACRIAVLKFKGSLRQLRLFFRTNFIKGLGSQHLLTRQMQKW